MDAQHSPLPWFTVANLNENSELHPMVSIWSGREPNESIVCNSCSPADAKLIIRACNNAQRFADALEYGSAIFDENNPNHEQVWEENADRGMTSEQVRAEAAQRLTAALLEWRSP